MLSLFVSLMYIIAKFSAQLSRVQLFLQLSIVIMSLLLLYVTAVTWLSLLLPILMLLVSIHMSCLVCFSLYIIQLCCSSLVLIIRMLLVACLLVLRRCAMSVLALIMTELSF